MIMTLHTKPEGSEKVNLFLSNPVGGAFLGQPNTATLTINEKDYFTELFDNDNDLEYQTITFTPDISDNFYSVCREKAVAFPTDPTGGTALSLSSYNYYQKISLSDEKLVFFYGKSFDSFYVGRYGYITFGTGDSANNESLERHFSRPRISALFDSLNPGVEKATWKQLDDRVAVTFDNVPETTKSGLNSFQIEMFFNGTIQITWLNISSEGGLAGLSAGNGLPDDFEESNLSSYLCAPLNRPGALQFKTDAFVIKEDCGNAFVTVTRSYGSNGTVTVDYTTGNGTAEAGKDYAPVSGKLTFNDGETEKTFSIPILADALKEGPETVNLILSNPGGGALLETPNTAVITVNETDYFTELFEHDNDLSYQSVTFTPDSSGSYYSVCMEKTASFPTDTSDSDAVSLSSYNYYRQISLAGGVTVSIYGVSYDSFYVDRNGYITFGRGDSADNESLDRHFSMPRISALFDSLYPGSDKVTWKQFADRVAVTYDNVPGTENMSLNSFQIEMFFDGKIRITYLNISSGGGLAGLSDGNGVPGDFIESNVSAYACPSIIPVLSVFPSFRDVSAAIGNTAFNIANTGSGPMNWTASENTAWLSISPNSGTDSGTITVSYDANFGKDRTGTITITAGNAENSPQTVEVSQSGVDSDDDGMSDTWENVHFGNLSHNGTADTDNDGLTDLQEYQNNTDPNKSDTDNDNIPDGWEVANNLNPNLASDAILDSDQDGVSNLNEYLEGTNPHEKDHYRIIGTVSYEENQAGQLYIAAYETTDTNYASPIGEQVHEWNSETGSVSFTLIVPDGTYYLRAYIDSNFSSNWNSGEPEGKYNSASIVISDADDATDRNFSVSVSVYVAVYDTNGNNRWEKNEAVNAVTDYLVYQTIDRDMAIRIVTAYLLGWAVDGT